jgi:maltooligosyltrehalose trehalohydrolase
MFMGDEWGATEIFPFFCDFKGDLADAVLKGRKSEFADAYSKYGDEIPDPVSQETREAAVLDWDARSRPPNAARLALTRALLAARKTFVATLIPAMVTPGEVRLESGLLTAHWAAGAKSLMLLANLSDDAKSNPATRWGTPIWGDTPPQALPPWSVYAAIGGG